jgi:hypothetical protein
MNVKIEINIKSNIEANLFLRAMWAKFRQEFSLSWQYTPFIKDKSAANKELVLGFISVPKLQNDAVLISIFSRQKGSIKQLSFEYIKDKPTANKLEEVVNFVLKNYTNLVYEEEVAFKLATQYPINHYKGKLFELKPALGGSSILSMKVKVFDNEDLYVETKYRRNLVENILSAIFGYRVHNGVSHEKDFKDFLKKTMGTKFNSEYILESDINIYAENITSDNTNNEVLTHNDIFFLPENIVKLIDYILTNFEFEKDIQYYISACRFVHNAMKIEDNNSSFQLYEIDTIEHIVTSYMSAIETLTLSWFGLNKEKCNSCGQDKYSIKQKMKDLIGLIYGINVSEPSYIINYINTCYEFRSNFVHSGSFVTHKHIVPIIPQISKGGNVLDYQGEGYNLRFILQRILLWVLENRIKQLL